jgi:hypothetical protein
MEANIASRNMLSLIVFECNSKVVLKERKYFFGIAVIYETHRDVVLSKSITSWNITI